MTRFAVYSQRVIVEGRVCPAFVVIAGETIEAVVTGVDRSALGSLRIIDVGEAVVMAGLCDTHVHINEPGRTEWEGFTTATRAAAAGGVTTVVDMPLNCSPVTTHEEALAIKLSACRPSLWVDVGFWGGVVPGNAKDLPGLADAGVLGAKAFLCDSGIEEFPAVDEPGLREAMRVLSAARIPLLAHAELELKAPAIIEPRRYASYLASRPAAWEEAAIATLVRLCRDTGCGVHIVHLSAASALPMLAAARAEGLPITVETCPHYLVLAAEDIEDGCTEMKCAPPIRGRENREGLWQGLRDGIIDMVTSDHSPCSPALKRRDLGDFQAAWGGISSLQLGLPLVWTAARARGFSLGDVARFMSEAPARVAGLSRKGRLDRGFDADLCIWRPDESFKVDASLLHDRHKFSPYVGRILEGTVLATYLRGQCVFATTPFAGWDLPRGHAERPTGKVCLGRSTYTPTQNREDSADGHPR